MRKHVDTAPKVQHFQLPTKLPAFVNKAALAVTGVVYSTLRAAIAPVSVKQVKDKEKSKAGSETKSPLLKRASQTLPQTKEGKEATKDTKKSAAHIFHWKKA
ncbi:MAG TPA: hypothetical protein VIJ46_07285 [Rhabdochlamydiaceae bacterium]